MAAALIKLSIRTEPKRIVQCLRCLPLLRSHREFTHQLCFSDFSLFGCFFVASYSGVFSAYTPRHHRLAGKHYKQKFTPVGAVVGVEVGADKQHRNWTWIYQVDINISPIELNVLHLFGTFLATWNSKHVTLPYMYPFIHTHMGISKDKDKKISFFKRWEGVVTRGGEDDLAWCQTAYSRCLNSVCSIKTQCC